MNTENITHVVMKLCSGEEIFATIVSIEGEIITFEDPMKISKRYTETPKGMTIQLNYEPFMEYSSNRHSFHRQHIMSCEPLVSRLSVLYADMKASTRSIHQESSVVPSNITIH